MEGEGDRAGQGSEPGQSRRERDGTGRGGAGQGTGRGVVLWVQLLSGVAREENTRPLKIPQREGKKTSGHFIKGKIK